MSGTIIHPEPLRPSDPDTIHLGRAVESRFLDLCSAYRRIKGDDLVPPQDLDGDMLNWRAMMLRHQKRDFRHTVTELRSLQMVAQWTVDVNNNIRNQAPAEPISWRPSI
jgi:valyl-tRNA synthetase